MGVLSSWAITMNAVSWAAEFRSQSGTRAPAPAVLPALRDANLTFLCATPRHQPELRSLQKVNLHIPDLSL